ncbi:transposase [Leisingera sp.]|uniref:transposase n=1 Tax=Leisingera sp. TaxID=1879318 RepID=UPI002B2664C4|nr:transposase [Leisingera sp.]
MPGERSAERHADPARFSSSKRVGPGAGLTPARNQSRERDISGGTTMAGDTNLRRRCARPQRSRGTGADRHG